MEDTSWCIRKMESKTRITEKPYFKHLQKIIATQRDAAREYRRTISSQKKEIAKLEKELEAKTEFVRASLKDYFGNYENHGKMFK